MRLTSFSLLCYVFWLWQWLWRDCVAAILKNRGATSPLAPLGGLQVTSTSIISRTAYYSCTATALLLLCQCIYMLIYTLCQMLVRFPLPASASASTSAAAWLCSARGGAHLYTITAMPHCSLISPFLFLCTTVWNAHSLSLELNHTLSYWFIPVTNPHSFSFLRIPLFDMQLHSVVHVSHTV